jgi:hypothetical protein
MVFTSLISCAVTPKGLGEPAGVAEHGAKMVITIHAPANSHVKPRFTRSIMKENSGIRIMVAEE